MAIIEVNNQKINFDEKNYLNLKSLLPKLQKNFPLDEYSIESFTVNGEKIDINSEHPFLVRPIDHADHITIQFYKSQIQVLDLMNDLVGLTSKIISKIEQATDLYKNDEDSIAELHLIQIIDAVDIFIKSLSHLLKEGVDPSDIDESLPVKALQIHLLSIMKAIHGAHHKNDLIMLTDLLEYELKDNLTQWKILIIPALKAIVQ